jgi:chromosomal replication initiator protein
MVWEACQHVGDAQSLWITCCDLLRPQISDVVWRSTFHDARGVSFDGQALVLAVPNAIIRDRITGPYNSLVRDALAGVTDDEIELNVEVRPDAAAPLSGAASAVSEEQAPVAPPALPDTAATASVAGVETPEPPKRSGVGLDGTDPRYTFEAFVTGPSNRFAHAAALSVAEKPGESWNPLFIYGDAGLGKTHLLHAIGHYVRQNYPDKVIRYVSSETFLSEFVDSIHRGENVKEQFKRRYRNVQVLLVDDIQFIEKWDETQVEFFHTFNALEAAHAQIVLSSDRPPDAIAKLENRLRSRFKMGLITDIKPPDLETRLAILRKKAERDTTHIDHEVLEFIAANFTDNIRELEGALNRVAAYSDLTSTAPTVEIVRQVLSDSLGDRQPLLITPQLILDQTASMFGLSIEEITGRSRRRPLVTARQVAMYVMRELTDLSYPGIAREFGGRDHTTVIHAVEKITTLMRERRPIYDQVTDLIQTIRKGG